MSSNIKILIFDQDGTLYSRNNKLFRIQSVLTSRFVREKVKLSKNKFDIFYDKLKSKYPNPLKAFEFLGINVNDYHKNVFNKINPGEYLKKDLRLIELFESLNTLNYIVTLSSPKYSLKLQKILVIKKFIRDTYCFSNKTTLLSKELFYRQIQKLHNLSSGRIYAIGDNYYNDILPAIKCGLQGILIDQYLKFNSKINYGNRLIICNSIYQIGEIVE